MINKETIYQAIIRILKKLKIPDDILKENYFEYELTGEIYKLDGISLCYLLFELESEYNILIPEDKILGYQFNSIESIAQIALNSICGNKQI